MTMSESGALLNGMVLKLDFLRAMSDFLTREDFTTLIDAYNHMLKGTFDESDVRKIDEVYNKFSKSKESHVAIS